MPHPHGPHLDLPRDLLPPRKRPKNDTEFFDKYGKASHKFWVHLRSFDIGLFITEHAAYRRMDGTDMSSAFQKHIVHELVNREYYDAV